MGVTKMKFEVGERYNPDELPENEMNNSGNVEWVGADLFALKLSDGRMVEFKMALECTAVYEMDDGDIGEVIDGEPRPLGKHNS